MIKTIIKIFIVYCLVISLGIFFTDRVNGGHKTILESLGNGFGIGWGNTKTTVQDVKNSDKFQQGVEDFKNGFKDSIQ
jgi:hypothetical protein